MLPGTAIATVAVTASLAALAAVFLSTATVEIVCDGEEGKDDYVKEYVGNSVHVV